MSWTAYLTDDRGHEEGDWNFTHNTNGISFEYDLIALSPRSPIVRLRFLP